MASMRKEGDKEFEDMRKEIFRKEESPCPQRSDWCPMSHLKSSRSPLCEMVGYKKMSVSVLDGEGKTLIMGKGRFKTGPNYKNYSNFQNYKNLNKYEEEKRKKGERTLRKNKSWQHMKKGGGGIMRANMGVERQRPSTSSWGWGAPVHSSHTNNLDSKILPFTGAVAKKLGLMGNKKGSVNIGFGQWVGGSHGKEGGIVYEGEGMAIPGLNNVVAFGGDPVFLTGNTANLHDKGRGKGVGAGTHGVVTLTPTDTHTYHKQIMGHPSGNLGENIITYGGGGGSQIKTIQKKYPSPIPLTVTATMHKKNTPGIVIEQLESEATWDIDRTLSTDNKIEDIVNTRAGVGPTIKIKIQNPKMLDIEEVNRVGDLGSARSRVGEKGDGEGVLITDRDDPQYTYSQFLKDSPNKEDKTPNNNKYSPENKLVSRGVITSYRERSPEDINKSKNASNYETKLTVTSYPGSPRLDLVNIGKREERKAVSRRVLELNPQRPFLGGCAGDKARGSGRVEEWEGGLLRRGKVKVKNNWQGYRGNKSLSSKQGRSVVRNKKGYIIHDMHSNNIEETQSIPVTNINTQELPGERRRVRGKVRRIKVRGGENASNPSNASSTPNAWNASEAVGIVNGGNPKGSPREGASFSQSHPESPMNKPRREVETAVGQMQPLIHPVPKVYTIPFHHHNQNYSINTNIPLNNSLNLPGGTTNWRGNRAAWPKHSPEGAGGGGGGVGGASTLYTLQPHDPNKLRNLRSERRSESSSLTLRHKKSIYIYIYY